MHRYHWGPTLVSGLHSSGGVQERLLFSAHPEQPPPTRDWGLQVKQLELDSRPRNQMGSQDADQVWPGVSGAQQSVSPSSQKQGTIRIPHSAKWIPRLGLWATCYWLSWWSCLNVVVIPSGEALASLSLTPHQMLLEQVLQPQRDQLRAWLFRVSQAVLCLLFHKQSQACPLQLAFSTKNGTEHSREYSLVSQAPFSTK